MPGDEGELTLAPVAGEEQLSELLGDVFADPETRRGMGWTEDDDSEEAMEAISGLWQRRLAAGWHVYDVRKRGQRVGLAGLGPHEDDGTAWWAVYLLERGEGLGKRVGRRLLEQARREGAKEALAVTWARNEASRGLLEALGFTETGPAPYDWARESELDWLAYRRKLG